MRSQLNDTAPIILSRGIELAIEVMHIAFQEAAQPIF